MVIASVKEEKTAEGLAEEVEKKKEIIQYCGTGRRKTSVARVRLILGEGNIFVNKKPYDKYFNRIAYYKAIRHPLEVTSLISRFNVLAKVQGGGHTGQAEAIRLGIARALLKYDGDLRPTLSKEKLLTRDPRMVERKKYGRKGARARFQFSKR